MYIATARELFCAQTIMKSLVARHMLFVGALCLTLISCHKNGLSHRPALVMVEVVLKDLIVPIIFPFLVTINHLLSILLKCTTVMEEIL